MNHTAVRFPILLFVALQLASGNLTGQVPMINFSPPEVWFTDPLKISVGQEDFTLLNRMLELVNSVPSGEEITVCVFKFEKGKLARALLEAEDRGVKIRVIINKGETSEEINRDTKELFKTELDDFHYIKNTITKKSIIHNKFMLFSRIETVGGSHSNVVLQTSSNFQDKGTGKLQDLIVTADQGLYHAYLDFWYEIKVLGNASRLDDYDYLKFSGSNLYKAYFFPKREDGEEIGKDNVVQILKHIKQPSSTIIRFAHGKWTPGREKVVNQLDEAISNVARIEIITNGDLDYEIRSQLLDLNANLTTLGMEANLHTKFFLVDDGTSQIVYTGSHNLSERSLRDNFEGHA